MVKLIARGPITLIRECMDARPGVTFDTESLTYACADRRA